MPDTMLQALGGKRSHNKASPILPIITYKSGDLLCDIVKNDKCLILISGSHRPALWVGQKVDCSPNLLCKVCSF